MMKLLPGRHILGWTAPFSASASCSTRTTAMIAPGKLCLQLLAQHSLPGSSNGGILAKLGIGSTIRQWVSGGVRTVEWQQPRLLGSTNVLPLGVRCEGDFSPGSGRVKENFETFRGRGGRGGRAGSGRGRGGGGRGSFRPPFDRTEDGPKRFYSSDSGPPEEFRNTEGFRGRGRGRGRFGNGGQRGRFSSPGRGSEDRESFRDRGQSGGDMTSFRGRGRDRGSGSSSYGSQREPFRSAAGQEGDGESFRGRRDYGNDDEGDRESFRSRRSFGGDDEGDRESSRGRSNFDNDDEGGRESFRGRGRGSFGAMRGGRGSFGATRGGRGNFGAMRGGRGRGSFGAARGGRGSYGASRGGRSSYDASRGGRSSYDASRGGRGSFRDTQSGREGASRSLSPYNRNSDPESDTRRRWDPAQSQTTRGGRGYSSRGSRGGRGSFSARGGRPPSNFGDRRSRDDDEETAPSSPRRGEQPFEGEEKWQRKVREKKAKKVHAREDSEEDGVDYPAEGVEDDPEEAGQQYPQPDVEEPGEGSAAGEGLQEGRLQIWRRQKINWLCKEIPTLRPTGIVTMLNSQRKWIEAVDTKEVMETLMRRNEILRAHRVLKWTMQQPWYENDFELNTKMANTLGTNGKLSRMRELFDTIIATGQVPDISTYVILVKAYIADEAGESIEEAYTIYNQMEQFGGYQQPAAVAFSLFQAFTDRKGGAHLRRLHQADALFESMRNKGTSWCNGLTPDQWRTLYTALIHLHSTQGNEERVRALVTNMREAEISLHPDCYAALIRVCAKDGNAAEAESIFQELIAAGHTPDWRAYVALIQTYGAAGLPDKVESTFKEMEAEEVHVNLNVFEAVVEAMAKSGDIDRALAALEKAEKKFATVLHSSYNLLMEWYKSKDMLHEVEALFNRMKEKKCRPNLQSYNNLIDSYILRGQLDRAEEVFETMKRLQGFNPNQKTCSLIIEAFSKAGVSEKVKEVYAYLTERNMELPDEVRANVAELVGEKVPAKSKLMKLIPEQREMLVGVLLGGAKIASYDHNRTYEITFELGDGQEEWGPILINHLYDMFADWAQQAPRVEVLEDDVSKVHRFSTVSHGSFRFYAHQYRPEGEPVIPRLIHRWLNPLSLAYWYMYGGTKCKNTGGIILNACQYSSKELTLVVKALKARTVDCVIKKRRSGNVLLFKDESAAWIWRLMEPHILDELKDLLRPNMPVNTRDKNPPEAFDETSEVKVTEDEADVDVEEAPVKVGALET